LAFFEKKRASSKSADEDISTVGLVFFGGGIFEEIFLF